MTVGFERVAAEIRRRGPIRFSDFMEIALYEPEVGFYATGGGAGRRGGDFITSPEVGPLFGAVVARAIDGWWDEMDRPDPYVVVEAGAGVGTLARSVLAAGPTCAPALRYVLVERSAAMRAGHGEHLPLRPASAGIEPGDGPAVLSLPELPVHRAKSVVVANELLDNLPVDLWERTPDGWREVRVGLDDVAGALVEVLVEVDEPHDAPAVVEELAPDAEAGARIPVARGAIEWVADAVPRPGLSDGGRLVAFDYGADTPALATRPMSEWLRTYRGHERGAGHLEAVGEQDITCEVPWDQLGVHRVDRTTQADWLRLWGIDDLVEQGRRAWHDGAATGDLAVLKARSAIREAEALLDPTGLGAFTVVEFPVDAPPNVVH